MPFEITVTKVFPATAGTLAQVCAAYFLLRVENAKRFSLVVFDRVAIKVSLPPFVALHCLAFSSLLDGELQI
jgi:hypothetical protein